jgi:hypothetical protein
MRNVADVRDKSDNGWMPWNHGLHFALRIGLVAWSRPNAAWKRNEPLGGIHSVTHSVRVVFLVEGQIFLSGVCVFWQIPYKALFITAWRTIRFFVIFTLCGTVWLNIWPLRKLPAIIQSKRLVIINSHPLLLIIFRFPIPKLIKLFSGQSLLKSLQLTNLWVCAC